MIEIKFYQNGDESGEMMTREFKSWYAAEAFMTEERKSIEVFSENEIGGSTCTECKGSGKIDDVSCPYCGRGDVIESGLLGKLVTVKKNKFTGYDGHWGFIRKVSGDELHVSGGTFGDDVAPIFDKSELNFPKKVDSFRKAGAKVDDDGFEIF